MACVAVNSLVRTLDIEFLQPRPRPIVLEYHLISDNKGLIQSLHQKLEYLIELFDESRIDMVKDIKELETKLRDVAFEVEDEIELLIVHISTTPSDMSSGVHVPDPNQIAPGDKLEEENEASPSLRLFHILQKAIGDIDAIEEELIKVKNAYTKSLQRRVFPRFAEVNTAGFASKDASHCEDKMVGKKDDCNTIMEMLTESQDKQLKFISIEGMGGIGKTTLANAVYEDPSIVHHFDVRGWTVASQHHNKRQMLVDLLKSVSKQDIADDEDEGDLALQLKQALMGPKYLIVLDDLWSSDAWDSMKTCFPDEGNSSRVMLTTRIGEVAKYICSHNNYFHQMQLLDEEASWDLFSEKACISCNDKDKFLWKPIVSKCKGLPLAIVVVAGLFSKINTQDERNSVAETLLASASTTMDEEISRILSLSYNHLPHYLKACFLYLAVFPEDEEIDANVLARLWSAEGLVKGLKNERYDEVANRYVQDLKDRNLIILSKLSSCGKKIKLFRVHDMVHALCTKDAQNENLLHIVGGNGFDFTIKRFRWVSVPIMTSDLPKNDLCRSIICFREWEWSELHHFNLKPFKLLRVFHDGTFEIDVDLFHLRYIFSFNSSLDSIIRPLRTWNLQTVVSVLGEVPWHIFELPKQQYIRCDNFTNRFHIRNVNQNMLSICKLRPGGCIKELFTKMPNLKKVCISAYGECSDNEDMVEDLGHLQLLEKLYLTGIVLKKCQLFHLNNLKSLRLLWVEFEWSEINMLCKLPSLTVLRIVYGHHLDGDEWELSEEEKFRKLIFLEIRSYYLKHWRASADSFPKLERLSLTNCEKLEEFPAEFPNLKLIKLERCLPSAVDLARQIQEEQCDLGNDDMVVIEKDTLSQDLYEEYNGV